MEKDIEDVLEDQKNQSRHETEPSASTDEEDDVPLPEAVTAAYDRIENDNVPENLTMRDTNLAALFDGLGATDELSSVGQDAADHLESETDGDLDARGTVLGLLVRVGLSEVAPETIDAAKEGKREYLASQADEF